MKKFSLIILTLSFLTSTLAQGFSSEEVAFLNYNVAPISLENNFSNGDWSSVKKAIGNKKIVLLGEFNHETHEIFKIKNDLIKYLHEDLGFNTILFEAGIGELILPNQEKHQLTPAQMTYGFFGYWRTPDFIDLMTLVKNKKMNIAGFDVQRFGNSFDSILKKEAQDLSINEEMYTSIELRFGEVQDLVTDRKAVYDSVIDETNQLINSYKNLLASFDQGESTNVKWVRQTIKNRIYYLEFRLQFLKDHDWNKRWIARDSMMAENVSWLLDNFYQDEKVIIYAHNFHIAKFNEKEEVMGEYLSKSMINDMYSVGFFAGSGTYGNDRSLSAPDSLRLDIKHIIHQLNAGVHFLNIPSSPIRGSNWLFKPIVVNDTFIDLSNSNSMNLSKQFDGLILVDKISSN